MPAQPQRKSDKVNSPAASPLYLKVAQNLRRCIELGSIPDGVHMNETAVADLFEISRTPARHALEWLVSEGLAYASTSRGFVTGKPEIAPVGKLTPAMLDNSDLDHEQFQPSREWQDVYDRIEHDIVRLSILSSWRLSVRAMESEYRASRGAIEDVLVKLESTGLLQRRDQAHWMIVPLTTARLENIFDVRSWLEPNLLAQATIHVPFEVLEKIYDKHEKALAAYPDVTGTELDALETYLHDTLLRYARNPVGLSALRAVRAGLISSKHILASREIPLEDDNEPFIGEHLSVLEAVRRRKSDESRLRLNAHLLKSRTGVILRLRKFRKIAELPDLSFAKPVSSRLFQ